MNSRKVPLISVVMGVYNGEDFLRESIDSILAQTFTNFEFIIINDGSTDGTSKILASYNDPRIILLAHSNKGLVKSLNEGIKKSRGKYIARQDADDLSAVDRLEEQIKLIESDSKIGLVGSYFQHIDTRGKLVDDKIILPFRSDDLKARMLFSNAFGHGTVVFRKDIFEKVGGYRNNYGANEDFDLWRRIAGTSKIANLPKILYNYRINPQGIVANTDESYKEDFDTILQENRSAIKDRRSYLYLLKSAYLYRFTGGQYKKEQYQIFISDQWHILPILVGVRDRRQILRLLCFLLIVQPIKTIRYILGMGVRKVRVHG